MRATAPADDTRAPAPVAGGASPAQRLARATSGAIEYEDDGRVSVLFPPPGAVLAAPAVGLAREESAPVPATVLAAPAAAPAPAHDAAAPGAATGTPAPAGAIDRDELYEDFMRRLRRDVLEQREQLGDL
jgi:hypothetical protein